MKQGRRSKAKVGTMSQASERQEFSERNNNNDA